MYSYFQKISFGNEDVDIVLRTCLNPAICEIEASSWQQYGVNVTSNCCNQQNCNGAQLDTQTDINSSTSLSYSFLQTMYLLTLSLCILM